MSLRVRIFLSFLLVQLASAVLILGWYFYSLQAELAALTRNNAQEAVLQSIDSTEDYFLPAETLAEAGRYLLSAGLLGRDRPEQLERYFFEQLQSWPQIAGLYVGYPDGGFFYVMLSDEEASGGTRTKIIETRDDSRRVRLIWRDQDFEAVRSDEDPQDAYDPRSRSWYRDAIARGDSVWTDPYVFFTSRKPGITLAVPLSGVDGEPPAVFGVDIEISEISGFLTRSSLGLRGTAFIATADGQVIAHSNAGIVAEGGESDSSLRFRRLEELGGIEAQIGTRVLALFSQSAATGPAAVWEETFDGSAFFVAVGRMSEVNWPWQLVVMAPKSDQFEVGRSSTLVLIGVILLAMALACLVGLGVSRKLGRLVAGLHRNALLARNGNVELIDRNATGVREVDETNAVLGEFARVRREAGGAHSEAEPNAPGGGRPRQS